MLKEIVKKVLVCINYNLNNFKLWFEISCTLLLIIKYIKAIKKKWFPNKAKSQENEFNIILPLLLFSVIKNTPIHFKETGDGVFTMLTKKEILEQVHFPKGRAGVIKPILQKVVSLRDGHFFYLCSQTPFQEILIAGLGGYAAAFGILAMPGSLEYLNTKATQTLAGINQIIIREKKTGGLFDWKAIKYKFIHD